MCRIGPPLFVLQELAVLSTRAEMLMSSAPFYSCRAEPRQFLGKGLPSPPRQLRHNRRHFHIRVSRVVRIEL